MLQYRALFGPIAVVTLFLIGTRWSPFEPHAPPADPSGAPTGTISWDDRDWDVLAGVVTDAGARDLARLPMGELMAAIGQRLVGTPYVPGTLEVDGPERLVVNLRGLDCVTFVENVYALATIIKDDAAARTDDRAALETEYERALQTLRYRNGYIDGYATRLHYFSEWIIDNELKLLLTDITGELGGVIDQEPLNFMSTHRDAYRQLSDPDLLADIELIEDRLSSRGRYVIPEDRIGDVAPHIRNGDIIAATSSIRGLDVAHTGLALWVGDDLHLLHAPLVGDSVEISTLPLADRITRIDGQDGIIVARPHDPGFAAPHELPTPTER